MTYSATSRATKRTRQPEYHEHYCPHCPSRPRNRPPTLDEEREWWKHRYAGFWGADRIEHEAIVSWCWQYIRWVNLKGWRKPPNWSGERVPLSRIRPKGRPITFDEGRRWRQRMLAKHKGGEHDL